jgi:hypothetical protein
MEVVSCFTGDTKAYPNCHNSSLAVRYMGPNAGIVRLWIDNHSHRSGPAHLDGMATAALRCQAEVELGSGGHQPGLCRVGDSGFL